MLEEKSEQKKKVFKGEEECADVKEEAPASGDVGGGSAMKSRKDVYSMTHGFVRGKSLEEWQSDEEKEEGEEGEEDEEEEERTKALPAPPTMDVNAREEEEKREEKDKEEERIKIPLSSSSSDDEDKVDNFDIKKAYETKHLSDDDDDDDEEEYNNIDVDSEDDEGALQRAIFLSLERDNPGRVGRGLWEPSKRQRR